MKYFIISGEASGDMHAGHLLTELKKESGHTEARAWGGERLEQAGATVTKHYRELAFMGFVEVLLHLPDIQRNFKQCKQEILDFKPDLVILVDYPGFNLRMAKWAKNQGFKVVYYISPQVWAWKSNRVRLIEQHVDKMLCILPFEVDFYAQRGVQVDFVGHPLLDELQPGPGEQQAKLDASKPVIALLPGSRKQEISAVLPVMLQLPARFPDYEFVIAATPQVDAGIYTALTGAESGVKLVIGQTRQLLAQAYAACVTSGTATLETALLEVPLVVCYRGSWLSYQIARQLVKVKYISLVNLILDKNAVTELIQGELTINNLANALQDILIEPRRSLLQKDFQELKNRLGGPGASGRAARIIRQFLT